MSQRLVAGSWEKPITAPQTMPHRADIVVIGGGIVGVSTAWFLARQGINVALCEKAHIACEQSGRNWGWVRVQGRDTREIPMMLESLRIWASFPQEIGEDAGFTRGGCLFTANSDREMEALAGWLDIASEFGIESALLDAKEVRSLVQGVGVDWRGGLYTASDGRAEPHRAAPLIANAAERAGASVLTGCAVRGVETSAGSLSAVVTEHGRIETSVAVCATGAWTSMFCRSLGVDLPQLCVRGTVARTAPAPELFGGNIFDERLGIRRRADGGYTVAHGSVLDHPVTPSSFRYFPKFFRALLQELKIVRLEFGQAFVDELRRPPRWALDSESPFERQRILNPEPNPKVLRGIQRNLATVFPDLAATPLVETWAGMIEASPDIVPIIDELRAIPGLHVATGFSGHGFGIGPGAGKAVAGMLTGDDIGIDIEPLRLSRFYDGTPIRPQSTI